MIQANPSDKCRTLDDLFASFKDAGVNLTRMNQTDLHTIKQICNQKDSILWIHNYAKIEPYFINNAGKEHFGYESNDLSNEGFDFFTDMVHPDDLPVIHNTINYYNEFPKGTNRLAYRARRHDGEMRWMFSFDRVLNFNSVGSPQYLVAVSIDVENIADQNYYGIRTLKEKKEKLILYNSLTKREKEILHLIGQELTSNQMSAILFIESSTIDTHRKNIIKKLQVRSSMGLMQYSLLFASDAD